jgi:hypothetical protein
MDMSMGKSVGLNLLVFANVIEGVCGVVVEVKESVVIRIIGSVGLSLSFPTILTTS